jgi:hypothetical protein
MRMNVLRALLIIGLGIGAAAAADPEVPMREPFTLTLHVDKDHYYEENIGPMPYVHEGGVYLMKGDRFGISLAVADGKLQAIAYQPDFEKADVTFEFRQEDAMMMLTIHNRTSHQLKMKALMTVPGRKNAAETSIIPVEPGLTNFESWPHPIVKLLLHEIEFGS